jgi:DNA polymerase-1
MMMKGMRVDKKDLEITKQEVEGQIVTKQAELDKIVGHPLNVNSPKQCAQYFYVELGLPAVLSPKTRAVTTDNMAMQKLVRGTQKHGSVYAAKLVQEIRGLSKLNGTYLSTGIDADGRIRGSYNPRGTKFGRLSSSKTIEDTGLNYQNIPPEFKKFLVADPGKILMELDKRQAEWVVVAYFCNDANMIKAIKDGLDVHAYTASLMFNLPLEIIKYENSLVGHSTHAQEIYDIRKGDDLLSKIMTPQWPRTMSMRQCGKKSNHGLNYDEGPNNFALINEMEISEAKRIVNLYHTIYPGIRRGHEAIRKQLQKDRTLVNCFGRKVRFLGQWECPLWKSAYSMIPQSTVVDSLNTGMVQIYNNKWLTTDLDIDILAQVHDSILMQIPVEHMANGATFHNILDTCLSFLTPELQYNGNTFHIETDGKIGVNWGSYNAKTNILGMRDLKDYNSVKQLLESMNA